MKLYKSQAFKPASSPESQAPRPAFAGRVAAWSAQHPVLAIVFVSLLAVVVNCYPVVFCGKSFVSPTDGMAMVYDWWPPLPGMEPTPQVSEHGSDTAAELIWGVPVGFIESRSLLEHGELPLWNRYGHAGEALLGQAISMLGDPLHLIVIFGHGSAGAWDIKFLTAKFLFCVGFGLLILRLLENRSLSLIYAALAAYCGAFFYIYNHPAFFVFSYAPWILLSALASLDLRTKSRIRWGLAWLLVTFACFNAGHVELAVVLIVGLNLAAAAGALAGGHNLADPARVVARMAMGTLLFLGLTAPMWMSFLVALENSYSLHSDVRVTQLPFVSLPGIFDDLFFLLPLKDDSFASVAPGTSLLVMAGCILSALRWRQIKGETFFWVNTSAIMLWGGCVFGWVPATVLAAIPFLNRVGHVYTDFSYLLVIHLTIQSAYGFKCLEREVNFRRATVDFLRVGLIFAGIILVYCIGITHRPIPWGYFLFVGVGAAGALLLFAFLRSCHGQIPALGWAVVIILGFVANYRFGLYTFGSKDLLMLPGPRVILNAPSQAIDKIQADKSDPFRVVGVQWNLFGNYSAVYGLEDIRSCAPLSSGEFINLIRKSPGVKLRKGWVVEVEDLFAAQPLLNLFNVKYLLTPPRVVLQEGLNFRLRGRSDFGIVENLEVWPRAFFSDQVNSISSTEEFIQQLSENGKEPFIALTPEEIEKQPGLRQLQTARKATVAAATNYRLLPNSTAFDIHAPSAGMVCLTEGQAKDFIARANNKPKEILTVNRAFKGVYLDQPGNYHLEFIYRPRHWRLACALFWTAAGSVIVLASVSFVRLRSRKGNV